jgi:NADPH2:quinone reductase
MDSVFCLFSDIRRKPQYVKPGKRVIVSEFGETPLDAVENYLSIETQPPPDTAELGTGDVIVAVKSASVGWVDLLMTSGQYQHMASPPYTPGLEYAGVVVWTGADVDSNRVAVGDEVIADPFIVGPRTSGDYRKYGGFATYTVIPMEAALPLPKGLSFDQGCNLLGNYETAYHCLVARGQLVAGETVLIHGASGSTGIAAVHVAKQLGATVIATGRSADKLAVVKEQGADHVICCKREDGEPGIRRFRDDVKALTDGRGVDVVYDGVGGPISLETLRSVTFGARYLIVGWAATPFVAKGRGGRGAPNANVLPTNLIMMKGLNVLGCPTVISTQRDPSIRKGRLEQILAWVDSGLTPYVTQSYAMTDIQAAMHAKWSSQFVGGCVVHPEE